MENYMKMEIAARSENESFARSAVAAFALTLNPSLTELSDIKTAVSEAVTNCVVHAYRDNEENAKILIECKTETLPVQAHRGDRCEKYGVIHITVADLGCGIEDIDKATTPFFTTLQDDERSGMGFTIMQTFMDEFSVESEKGKGTRVRMTKKIKATENGEVKERVNA
ncbi:MAG: anti-sigma F factor [Clostridia bacterium]|nr:anti-sigma F factor [Clostridia bacterium]